MLSLKVMQHKQAEHLLLRLAELKTYQTKLERQETIQQLLVLPPMRERKAQLLSVVMPTMILLLKMQQIQIILHLRIKQELLV